MVSGFGFQVSGSWFRVSGFGLMVSVFGFRVFSSWFRVSGFGYVFKVSGSDLEHEGAVEAQLRHVLLVHVLCLRFAFGV